MKILKNLFIVLLVVGAVGGVISFIESQNQAPVSSQENENYTGNDYYDDNYYDDSYNNNYDNNYNNNYNNNYDNSYNNAGSNNNSTNTGTSFREQAKANREKVQDALNKDNSSSNNQTSDNKSGVNIVQIGGDGNKNSYDGKYDQGSPNYVGTNTGSSVTTNPNTNQNPVTKPNTNTNTNTTTKPNTNITVKPNTNTNTVTKPNTNTNTNVNTNVTKPQTGGTSPSLGARVPLDTTGDYDDIVLTDSDRNDIVMMQINKNKDNLLSSLTGYEEPLRVAVGLFNAYKHEDSAALSKYYYSGKTKSDLTGHSMKYVAYRVVEYHKFSQEDIDKVEKSARITMGIDDSEKITGYYRITMRVFQSENRKINIIKDESKYPFYWTVTLIEVNGVPYSYMELTRQ